MGCAAGVDPFLGLRTTRLSTQEHKTRHRGSRSTGGLCREVKQPKRWRSHKIAGLALHDTVSTSCAAVPERRVCTGIGSAAPDAAGSEPHMMPWAEEKGETPSMMT